jgi:UrcA family protein
MDIRASKLHVLVAAGGMLAGGAGLAQQLGEIVVESSPATVQRVKGYVGDTQQVKLMSVTYAVNYADLNLATHSGALALEQRIHDAAKKGCDQIDKLYPLEPAPAGDPPCLKTAVDKAMVKARAAVAHAEAGAKK